MSKDFLFNRIRAGSFIVLKRQKRERCVPFTINFRILLKVDFSKFGRIPHVDRFSVMEKRYCGTVCNFELQILPKIEHTLFTFFMIKCPDLSS